LTDKGIRANQGWQNQKVKKKKEKKKGDIIKIAIPPAVYADEDSK
jgi:hypothetical protein